MHGLADVSENPFYIFAIYPTGVLPALQPLIPSSDLFGKGLLFSWLLASFGM
jgi:hypothetical protein